MFEEIKETPELLENSPGQNETISKQASNVETIRKSYNGESLREMALKKREAQTDKILINNRIALLEKEHFTMLKKIEQT